MLNIIKRVKDRVQGKAPKGSKRSSYWPTVRKEFLKEHPHCAVCGGTKKVEVHHKVPFHMAPERELDVTNLITLCEIKKKGVNCHLLFGHLGNYKRVNETVEEDAARWREKLVTVKVGEPAPPPALAS